MTNRLLQHRDSVNEFIKDRPSISSLSEGEWCKLKTLTELLGPLKTATDKLGGANYLTASVALPCLKKLLYDYKKDEEEDPLYVAKFKDELCKEIEVTKTNLENNMLIKTATALDPRFKKLKCIEQRSREAVWQHIISMIKLSLYNDSENENDDRQDMSTACRKRCYESSDDEAEDPNSASTPAAAALATATQAVTAYRAVGQLHDETMDPTSWWRAHQEEHPLLAAIARKHLCCPATSVPSERLFSKAGNVISTKRSSITADNANMLICLASWLLLLSAISFKQASLK